MKKGLNNGYGWKGYGCFPISQVSDCKTDNNTVFQLIYYLITFPNISKYKFCNIKTNTNGLKIKQITHNRQFQGYPKKKLEPKCLGLNRQPNKACCG